MPSLSLRDVDRRSPVNWQHPLNAGRVLWLYGIPNQTGGGTWRDVTLRSNDGTLLNGPAWSPTGRGDCGVVLDATDDLVSVPNSAILKPASVTVAVWVNVTAWAGNQYVVLAGMVENAWGNGYGLVANPESGGRIGFWVNNYNTGGTAYAARSALTLGAWSRLVGSYDPAAGVVSFYLNGLPAASAAYSTAINQSTNPFRVGYVSGLAPLNGSAGDVSVWSRALSAGEVALDYDLSRRQYPGVLNRVRRWYPVAPAGGTTYTASLSGSATPAGALALRPAKAIAGSATPAGSLAKLVAKPLAGSATGAGALARLTAKHPAGSTAASGSLAKVVGKSLAGSTTATGALAKQPRKSLAGSSTPSGALSAVKVALLALAGSVTAAGSLVRAAAKAIAGSVATAGAVAKSVAKHPAGSVTPSGAVAKAASKAFAGSTTPAGSVTTTRLVLRSLAGAVTAAGALARAAWKRLAGLVTGAGELTTSGGSTPSTGPARRYVVQGTDRSRRTIAGADRTRRTLPTADLTGGS